MSDKKIIAVVGATGAQGGGLVRAILDDPDGGFTVRAITRDVNSEAARALAKAGAEVVAADIDDEASLAAALKGALRRLLRDLLLGALFSRQRESADPQFGGSSEGCGTEACHLVHP